MPRTSSNSSKSGQEAEWSIPSLREPRYSQSLERGLAILGCFTPERPVLGIADIADDLGMSRSTTHRYVITLVALGFLEQGASRKYRLGLRVTDLGMSALNSTGLREHARPYLEELRQRTSYTVNLSVLDGTEILYVDRARSFRRGQNKIDLESAPRLAAARLLHLDGQGAAGEPARGRAARPDREHDAHRRGPNSITSKKALRTELEHVLERAWPSTMKSSPRDCTRSQRRFAPSRARSWPRSNIAAHSSMISLEELVDALGPHLSPPPTTSPRDSATAATTSKARMDCKTAGREQPPPSGLGRRPGDASSRRSPLA